MKYAVIGVALIATFAAGSATGVRWEKGQQAIRGLQIANDLADQQRLIFAKHRNTERGWMDDVSAARNQRTEREKRTQTELDRAHSELDGLRDDNRAAVERLATASADAVRKYAAAAGVVLEQCTAEYLSVARDAQGHAADSLMYQFGWPKRK